jgi:hypothetical protein
MATADANGTTITSTILNNGNIGPDESWTITPATPTGLTIDDGIGPAPLESITVTGGGTFATNATFRSIAIDHTHNFIFIDRSLSSRSIRLLSVAGWITVGVPDEGVSSELYDYWGIYGEITGEYVVMQLDSGRGGVGYGINIETNPGGVTTHSAYITLTPGSTYWCALQADFTGGTARLNIYSTSGNLVGSVTLSQTTGENIEKLRIGQIEAGTAIGTSYMKCVMLDYTNHVFPLGPGVAGAVTPPFFTHLSAQRL